MPLGSNTKLALGEGNSNCPEETLNAPKELTDKLGSVSSFDISKNFSRFEGARKFLFAPSPNR